jgi:exopolyphosphatase/guanosine-5'-triphosphate,3'-diphosphate pyrophosphatase
VSPTGERLAAIDVGSNTILLTIADYNMEIGLEVLEEGEDQPRLGAGLTESGRLGESAMRQALGTLERMLDTCRRHGVQRIAAVATAAVREASNGSDFVRRVQELDIPLRLISPETEAALSYRSASYRFPGNDPMLLADIGGGSLELVGAAAGSVKLTVSLPLGAVRLTERHSTQEKLREHIGETLANAIPGDEWRGARFIGCGGTFATLAGMVLARRGSAGEPIHGTRVRGLEVRDLLVSLLMMSPERRREMPGLRPERADIIVAGLTVVAELSGLIEAEEVTVSGFGLRDGLLLEMVGLGAGS